MIIHCEKVLEADKSVKDKKEKSPDRLEAVQRKVLNSLKKHWKGLTVFLNHPEVPMDNNPAEQSMRNPVLGRKGYYGSGSIWSARLAAMMFSIFQTLSIWNLNPRTWLRLYLDACANNGGAPLSLITYQQLK
jgi:transposase